MSWQKQLDKNGVLFMMTNNYVDEVKETFDGYNVESLKVKRFIDSLKSKDGEVRTERSDVLEAVIRNYS